MRTQKSILLVLFAFSWLLLQGNLRAIENDPAKEYPLTEKHGPWMIMVTTFSNVQDENRKKQGLTAEEAASHLVHELREKGIPAYAYSQDAKTEKIETYDRLGNKDKRRYQSQLDMVCVLAGNYPNIDHPVAQKTLAYVKKFRPKFMADPKSGAVVREGVGNQKGPFGGAFLTINPQLNPSNVVQQKPDNETKYLNSGIDFPLVKLKHKYTLKVATFTGKSVVPLGSSKFNGHEANFDKSLFDSGPYSLARAGEDATQLTYAMRQKSAATRALGRDRFEAYVYHDKFQSFVTVGGFDSKDDPEIKRLAEIFQAKYKKPKMSNSDDSDETNGSTTEGGEYVLLAESISLPGANPNSPPIQTWAFDPVPELIEVPRIK